MQARMSRGQRNRSGDERWPRRKVRFPLTLPRHLGPLSKLPGGVPPPCLDDIAWVPPQTPPGSARCTRASPHP